MQMAAVSEPATVNPPTPPPPPPPAMPPPQQLPVPTSVPTPAFVPAAEPTVGRAPGLVHQTPPDMVEEREVAGAAGVPPRAAVPAAQPARRRPAPAAVRPSRDELVEERPIRVGRVQWPPPRVDDRKPELQVGRLEIEESDEMSSAISTRPTAAAVSRQNIQDRVVTGRQNDALPVSSQPVAYSFIYSFIHLLMKMVH